MAGKTEYLFLVGKGRWCKFFAPSQYGKFSVEFAPDEASLSTLMELKKEGIRNVIKRDDEGVYRLNISRNSIIRTKGGADMANSPPVVIDKDGNPWNKDKGIGNDSDMTIKVAVRRYKVPMTGKEGVAIGLESVRIDNLIDFNPNTDWPESNAKKQISGLAEQPKPPWEEE